MWGTGSGRAEATYGRLAIRSGRTLSNWSGYDHKFDTWCGEDTDILARLKRAGLAPKTFTNKSLNVIRHDASVPLQGISSTPRRWKARRKHERTIEGDRLEHRNRGE